jgi:hypothetical protein
MNPDPGGPKHADPANTDPNTGTIGEKVEQRLKIHSRTFMMGDEYLRNWVNKTGHYLVDITGMDDVMPGGGDGDENGRAVLAHLRLQAHLSSRGLGITFVNALPCLRANKCSGHGNIMIYGSGSVLWIRNCFNPDRVIV